ncbi:hypothetical protein G1K46_12335 [Tenacibaculum finnmarkense]|nr:hypothetical protein [Tenacibaculum finnmarkense]MCG8763504.1 hypothetical protein [Tenacibaculum finnmarkense]MCG8788888.1 hypothetical protein [Tenacibaculum finnmarkense]
MDKYINPLKSYLEKNELSFDDVDFSCLQYDIVDEMEKDEVGFEITQDIFDLMEEYPLVEFGSPGALTHFIEGFYNDNQEQYQTILKKSVREKPSIHTLWLLNRVINGTKGQIKAELTQIMKSIFEDNNLNEEIREVAGIFLE